MHLTHRLSDVKSFQNSRSNTCTPSHAIEFLSFGLAALDFRVFDVPSNGHAFSTCSRDFLFISFFFVLVLSMVFEMRSPRRQMSISAIRAGCAESKAVARKCVITPNYIQLLQGSIRSAGFIETK